MSPKDITPSDQMRASGSGRRKVALPPGRSQLDWVRNSARLRQPRPRTISLRELRLHCERGDAWMAIHGSVFDVSPYVEYHPGGVDMILAGAGKDGTNLFIKYHSWVNPEFMLKRCYLGTLQMGGIDEQSEDEDSEEAEENHEDASSLHSKDATKSGKASTPEASLTVVGDQFDEDLDALRTAELQESSL